MSSEGYWGGGAPSVFDGIFPVVMDGIMQYFCNITNTFLCYTMGASSMVSSLWGKVQKLGHIVLCGIACVVSENIF